MKGANYQKIRVLAWTAAIIFPTASFLRFVLVCLEYHARLSAVRARATATPLSVAQEEHTS